MPPRKRTKSRAEKEKECVLGSAGRHREGKRATKLKGVSGLVTMPVDVWFERNIPCRPAAYGAFYQGVSSTLMSRKSITVWRRARERFLPGLPDPSPVMSEPAWINLVLGNRCHVCVKTIRRAIDWDLGIRICRRVSLKGEHFALALMSINDLPQDELDVRMHSTLLTTHACQYEPLVGKEVAEQAAYIADGRRRWEKWLTLSRAGRDWVNEKVNKRNGELWRIQLSRRKQILDRLKDKGYGEELQDYNCLACFDNHSFVRQNRPLTDRTWDKHRDSLITFMDRQRARRLELISTLAAAGIPYRNGWS
ncbi:hypothetical protein BDZ89DRAFT_1143128 [Hymenopellis radicata]|nr:hypothetical protein BDZ89DRAFT_1143128 [Hymenopellis radicata]